MLEVTPLCGASQVERLERACRDGANVGAAGGTARRYGSFCDEAAEWQPLVAPVARPMPLFVQICGEAGKPSEEGVGARVAA